MGFDWADTEANKINVTVADTHDRHKAMNRLILTLWVMHTADRLGHICVHLNDSISALTPAKIISPSPRWGGMRYIL